MSMKRHIHIIFCAVLMFMPAAVSAATVSFRAFPHDVGTGDIVRVDVLLDSNIPINAFSGTVSYSSAMLEPTAVSDGNSIVNLWVIHPEVPVGGAPLTFTGITPGGFFGDSGLLFSVLFRAKGAGIADISIKDGQMLRNDGTGGKEPLTLKPLSLRIEAKPQGGYKEPADTIPPEPFIVSLGADPQLFDGRRYLVFTAVDKGSGIDHYALAESRVPTFLFWLFPLLWHETISPHVIADQNLTSAVYVKAIDRAGNGRLSVYPPRYFFTVYEKSILLAILIVVVLLYWRGRGRRFQGNL